MKILFVAGAEVFGGAERALLITVKGLLNAGHQAVVAVGRDAELLAQFRAERIPALHLPVVDTDWKNAHRFMYSVARLMRLSRRHDVDLLHTNETPSFHAAGYAGRLLGRPVVTHVRFPDDASAYAWHLKPGFTRAIFVSNYLRQAVENVAPVLFDGRADVVYDGVELPALPTPDERTACRLALGIPEDRQTVLIAGQVVESKGIWDYVEAARLLLARGVNATFVVLGDDLKNGGRTRREVEAHLANLDLARHFVFLGFRTDAPALISLFDVVTVPSHVESLGNATLEAMASGRPVVGARVGGIPEMIRDGETGFLVPVKSPHELAAAIERLVSNRDLSERYGMAGRVRAEAVFGVPAHVRRLEEVYQQVVAAPASMRARPRAAS